MTSDRKLLYGLFVLVMLLFVFQLITVFKAAKRQQVADSSAVIAAKDETIKAIQEHRQTLEIIAAQRQETIRLLETRDSVLSAHYLDNQKVYKSIDEKIKNIPVYIQRIAGNDDSIRAAFARHGKSVVE